VVTEGDKSLPTPDDWQAAAEAGRALRGQSAGARRGGWSPPSTRMAVEMVQELVDHARAGAPNEACGILAGDRPAEDGGMPTRFLPLRNAAASPYRYLIDPEEQLAVMLDIDDAGEVVWGIFHSHVASPPEPSATDVGLAFYPEAVYLICSLAGDEPVIRAWSIIDGSVTEVVLEVA
jgi:proteasome lid subunit RPN8/RPN11